MIFFKQSIKLFIGLVLLISTIVEATVYTVTNNQDYVPGSSVIQGSLRHAISQATSGSDTIEFDPTGQTITLIGGKISIYKRITIDGGTKGVTINGAGKQIFDLSTGSASGSTFKRIKFIKAGNPNGNGGAITAKGRNYTFEHCEFWGNQAKGQGGAIYMEASGISGSNLYIKHSLFDGNSSQSGAAIYLTDDAGLTLQNSYFKNNEALAGHGGAIYVNKYDVGTKKHQITESTFESNAASGDAGGAIYFNESRLEIFNSTFIGNNANKQGGAVASNSGSTRPVTIQHTTFLNNTTTDTGAASDTIYYGANELSALNIIALNNGTKNICEGTSSGNPNASYSVLQDNSCDPNNAGTDNEIVASGIAQNTIVDTSLTTKRCMQPVGLRTNSLSPPTAVPSPDCIKVLPLPANSPAINIGNSPRTYQYDQRGQNGYSLGSQTFPRAVGGITPTNNTPIADAGAFEATFYTVTLTRVENGSSIAPTAQQASVSCPASVIDGGTITCTAADTASHTFASFSANCTPNPSNAKECTVSNVTSATTITATFDRNTFDVTAAMAPVTGAGTFSCVPASVQYGYSTTCTAAPDTNAGYHSATFTSSIDASGIPGCVVSNTNRNECRVNSVTADVTVTATFSQDFYNYTVNALVDTNNPTSGSVLCDKAAVTSADTVTCVATPNVGYGNATFDPPICDANSPTNVCILSNLSADLTLVVYFSPSVVSNPYTITATHTPNSQNDNGGTFSCSQTTAAAGDTVTCLAVPNTADNYDTVTFDNSDCVVDSNNSQVCTFSNISANQSIMATFSQHYTVNALVDTNNPNSGSVLCDKAIVTSADTVTCVATPNAGYGNATFDPAICDANSPTNVCILNNLSADVGLVVYFSTSSGGGSNPYTITATHTPNSQNDNGGTFSCSQTTAAAGDTVTCLAVPNTADNYDTVTFDNSDCVVDSSNSQVCTFSNISANQSITATFSKGPLAIAGTIFEDSFE